MQEEAYDDKTPISKQEMTPDDEKVEVNTQENEA